MIHKLKTHQEPFAWILDGSKRHEVRKCRPSKIPTEGDYEKRQFSRGDTLFLCEWQKSGYGPGMMHREEARFTGAWVAVRVTNITQPGSFGLPDGLHFGLCCMTIEVITESRKHDSPILQQAMKLPVLGL